MPGRPTYLQGLVFVYFLFVLILALMSLGPRLKLLWWASRPPTWAFGLWAVTVALGMVVSISVITSPLTPAVGFMVRAGFLPAMLLGMWLAEKNSRLFRFLAVFVLCSSIVSFSGIAEHMVGRGPFGLLGPVREGSYSIVGTPGMDVSMRAGLMRSGEILALHASTGLILGLGLLVAGGGAHWSLLSLACAANTVAIFLSARRKYVMLVLIALGIFASVRMMVEHRDGSRKPFVKVLLSICVIGVIVELLIVGVTGAERHDYMGRIETLREGSWARLVRGLYAPLRVVDNVGFFGAGTGTHTLGVGQYARLEPFWTGKTWEAEFGLGRIVAEVGVLGLIAFVLMFAAVVNSILKNARRAGSRGIIQCLILAFVVGHAVMFVTAGQHFDDPFFQFYWNVLIGVGLVSCSRVRAAKAQTSIARAHTPLIR